MAKIILGAILNDIRGSIDADVYSVWKGQHYIRKKAASVSNPCTVPQQAIRNGLTQLSRRWFANLTDAQRQAWNEYAQNRGSASTENTSKSSRDLMPALGRNMSGYNAYIGCNAILAKYGESLIDTAPLGVDPLEAPSGLAVVGDGPPITKFTLTWADPPNIGAGDYIQIWLECTAGAHKQNFVRTGNGVQTYDITYVLGANGQSIGLPDGFYRFQLSAFDQNGQRSAGSNIVGINKAT